MKRRDPSQSDLDAYNSVKADFKKIIDYSDEELSSTIKVLAYKYPDAYDLLHFVDAYFELRRRRARAGQY